MKKPPSNRAKFTTSLHDFYILTLVMAYQILPDQLALSQPGGQIIPNSLLLAPHGFFDLPTAPK